MMDIDIESSLPSPTPSYLESILGLKLPLTSSFSSTSNLVSLLSEIKPKDKRKLEQLHILIFLLKEYTSDDAYKESKELAYAKVVKRDNNPSLYHTAEKDEISPTMAAFYFRDKSKANLSDKEAAAMKAIHYEPSYEMSIDNGIPSKKNSNVSNISNNNMNNDDDLSMCSNSNNNDMKLKKKRKGSFNAYNYNGNSSNGANMHSNTKSVTKKKRTSNNGGNNNSNNNTNNSGGEKEYCIPNCLLGRNDGSPQMVACDKCNSWFHWKCVGFEEEKKSQAQWYCMDCTNKINELNNNNNN